jgi:crotonobetainyl-CoA:carnitine CoA-transferase CaiB-like acyl-CoA transferase
VLGRPEWRIDPRFSSLSSRLENAEELDELITEWTAGRSDYEVMSALQAAGVAAGVVQNTEDQLRHDRQLADRGFFEEVPHRKKGTVIAAGIPLGLTGSPGRTGLAGAAVGEDNEYVFGELLGMTPEEIRRAIELGAIESRDEG